MDEIVQEAYAKSHSSDDDESHHDTESPSGTDGGDTSDSDDKAAGNEEGDSSDSSNVNDGDNDNQNESISGDHAAVKYTKNTEDFAEKPSMTNDDIQKIIVELEESGLWNDNLISEL
jgi:hypothetical protein